MRFGMDDKTRKTIYYFIMYTTAYIICTSPVMYQFISIFYEC